MNAAAREVSRLRLEGVDAILVLSKLTPELSADRARRVAGIDAIVADECHPGDSAFASDRWIQL